MTIVPDTKSWVWVLERPCPDCGFDGSTFAAGEVAGALQGIATQWETILARPDVAVRPDPAVWSPLEYGCHVRDVFVLFNRRIGRMLAEDDPQFENWDQDQTAVEDRYGEQNPTQVASDMTDAARTVAATLDSIEGQQWKRTGRRSDGASFTVDSIARYLLHDPVHHVWDVTGQRG